MSITLIKKFMTQKVIIFVKNFILTKNVRL